MADSANRAPEPRSFLSDVPTAAMSASLALMSRRSTAIADFWRSCAEVRQPTELMAVQLNFWTQLVDDYQEAFTESLAQLSPEQPTEAPPPSRARSA